MKLKLRGPSPAMTVACLASRAAALIRDDAVGRATSDHVVGSDRRGSVDEAAPDRAVRVELGFRVAVVCVEEALDELAVYLLADPAAERIGQVLDLCAAR